MLTGKEFVQYAPIKLDLEKYGHLYSKNVYIVVFPPTICQIDKVLMYAQAGIYKHPVVVSDNHFTLPVEFTKIFGNSLREVKLLPILSEDGYYYFVGSFINGKEQYSLTIDRKIRDLLRLKEKDIVEIRVKNNTFYSRVRRIDGNSMRPLFPAKIFKMAGLNTATPYQIKIKKSRKNFVSNDHFYSANKVNLEFDKFLKDGNFNLYEFLKSSYAKTEGGKLRKFRINRTNDERISVSYMSGGPISKEVKVKSTFEVNSEFFRMIGLLQAECLKSIKKTFCFTNKTPENVKYIIEWFEKYLNFSRELWLYELSIDPRIKNSDEIKEMWTNFLGIKPNLIKTYSKKFESKEPDKIGVLNLRSYGRTLKEIIMRLLECARDYVSKNKWAAGYFLSGVLAGDGFVVLTKEGSLNYIGISFDPNKNGKNENELEVYISCLKSIGIQSDDIKIYINVHEKTQEFIKMASKYGIEVKVQKRKSKGFSGEINIFKFRSFQKLAQFDPFFPNKLNVEKFYSSFNMIDRNRVRFL